MNKIRLNIIYYIIINIFILIFANSIVAETYYVAGNGTSSWNSATNINTPCSASIALNNAIAGDIILFRGGTYNPGSAPAWDRAAWNPANSGTPGNPITFKVFPGETAIISDNSVGPAFGAYQRDWIVWDGFTGTGKVSWQTYAYFFESEHCTIQNCDIAGFTNPSYQNNSCIGGNTAHFLTVKNNKLHDTSSTAPENGAAILLFFSFDVIVENNEFYNCSTGIFDKDWGTRNQYRYNYFHDNYTGFALGAQTGHDSNDIEVYRNIFSNNNMHIRILGTNAHNTIKIYNNVMYHNTPQNGIIRENESSVSDLHIYNNIIYNANIAVRMDSSDTITEMDYNCYYSIDYWKYENNYHSNLANFRSDIGVEHETNSFISNPLLLNIGSNKTSDYMLTENSPCKGLGKDGQDIGAFPNGNDGIFIGSWLGKPSKPAQPLTTPQ